MTDEAFPWPTSSGIARHRWESPAWTRNIAGSTGKCHRYRWVKITPILRQWLDFIGVKKSGPVIPRHDIDTYERWRRQLLAIGTDATWPFDALRHTHASFDYALRGDFNAVASNLGNSPTISRKHYIAPASRAEGEHFLRLTPAHIQALLAAEKSAS